MEVIMSTAILDEQKYRQLLITALPVVIHSKREYQRLLQIAKVLMERPEADISREEGRLLEMLSILVEEYEGRIHPLPKSAPHKMLNHILQEKGLKPADLTDILPKSRVSEILNGKRSISKRQAVALAEFLRVPVEAFL
jgi:HTH-type transcriptional regulator / antitoxin HigA